MLLDSAPLGSRDVLMLEGDTPEEGSRLLTKKEVDAAIREMQALVGILSEIDRGLVQFPGDQYLRLSAAFKEAMSLYRIAKNEFADSLRKVSR